VKQGVKLQGAYFKDLYRCKQDKSLFLTEKLPFPDKNHYILLMISTKQSNRSKTALKRLK